MTNAVDYKAGQAAYEADVAMRPIYHDGTSRTPWHKLASYAQWSWSRTDTDYGR